MEWVAFDAVAALLRDRYGVADADLAHLVHDLTAGVPALVELAGAAVADRHADHRSLLVELAGPGSAGARWVRDHVLADLPPAAAGLVAGLAGLDPITPSLCAALSGTAAVAAVDHLVRVGALTPRAAGTYRLVPVVDAVLRHQGSPAGDDRARLLRAAAWYERAGHPLAAARACADAGDTGRAATLIATRGDEMLAAGGAAEVVRIGTVLPDTERTDGVCLILADAARMAGDVAGAERAFAPLLARADRAGRGRHRPWRGGRRCCTTCAATTGTRWTCSTGPSRRAPGTADDGVRRGVPGHRTGRAGRHRAGVGGRVRRRWPGPTTTTRWPAAQLAAAFTTTGVRRDAHLAEALAAAERAGDVVIEARVLLNQADCLLREARYPQALARRRPRGAGRRGRVRPPGMLVIALHNAGEALNRLGRYDEAILHFERSMRLVPPGRAAPGRRRPVRPRRGQPPARPP